MFCTKCAIPLVFWMCFLLLFDTMTPLETDRRNCGGVLPGCLRCRWTSSSSPGDPDASANATDSGGGGGGLPLCLKCARLIVAESRQCVDDCPLGYKEVWSARVDYMGRMCSESSLLLGAVALSGARFSVVVGVVGGVAACALLLAGAAALIHWKRKVRNSPRRYKQEEQRLSSNSAQSTISRHSHSESVDRHEFCKQVSALRPDAPVFLAMMNDTRRQVRCLHQAAAANAAATAAATAATPSGFSAQQVQAYRPVLKDLSRILILLNRREDNMPYPPDDWKTLFAWGERVLRRYKKQHPQQVEQLVSFLQVPIQTNPQNASQRLSSRSSKMSGLSLSSFQPGPPSGPLSGRLSGQTSGPAAPASVDALRHLAISTFNTNYSVSPQRDWASHPGTSPHGTSPLGHGTPSLLEELDGGGDPKADVWNYRCRYSDLREWPGSRQFLEEDDFFTLGFRPQDEITTEL